MNGPLVQEERDIPYRAEVARKLLHLIALIIPLSMWHLGKEGSVLVFVPLAVLITVVDVLRFHSPWFYRFIDRYFGFMMRTRERHPEGSPFVLNGATCLMISAAVLSVVFPIRIASISLAVFMIADAFAALVGRRWGSHRWPRTDHTLEGSLAFFITASAALYLLGGFPVGRILATAAAGAFVEIFPRPLDDNIQVPIVMAMILAIPQLILFAP